MATRKVPFIRILLMAAAPSMRNGLGSGFGVIYQHVQQKNTTYKVYFLMKLFLCRKTA